MILGEVSPTEVALCSPVLLMKEKEERGRRVEEAEKEGEEREKDALFSVSRPFSPHHDQALLQQMPFHKIRKPRFVFNSFFR